MNDAAFFTEKLTPEKIAAWKKGIAEYPDSLYASGIILLLIEALEAKEQDFGRLSYLGNLARTRSHEEQSELNALLRQGGAKSGARVQETIDRLNGEILQLRSHDAHHLSEMTQALGLPECAGPPWGALIELAKTQYAQLEGFLTPVSTGEAVAAWKKLGLAMMFLADPQPLATADAENYRRLGASLYNLEHQLAAARSAAQRTEEAEEPVLP